MVSTYKKVGLFGYRYPLHPRFQAAVTSQSIAFCVFAIFGGFESEP